MVSYWVDFEPAGILHWVDARTSQVKPVRAPVMGGPADLTWDGTLLWVPARLEGKV